MIRPFTFLRISVIVILSVVGIQLAFAADDNRLADLVELVVEAIDVNAAEARKLIDRIGQLEGYDPDLLEAYATFYSGELEYSLSNWSEASKQYSRAIELSWNVKDTVRLCAAYNNLGLVKYYQGDFDQSIKNFSESLKLELALNNSYGIAQCYQNMAIVFDNGEQVGKTLDLYHKALDVYLKEQKWEEAAGVYNNIAAVYVEFGELDEAATYYDKAFEYYRKKRNNAMEARVLSNIGSLKMKQEKYDEAGRILERALVINKAEGDRFAEVSTYTMLGDNYAKKGEYLQSIYLYKKAEGLAVEYEMKELLLNVLNSEYLVFKQVKQYDSALANYERFISLRDGMLIDNPDFAKGVMDMELERQIEERDFRIKRANVRERLFWGIIFIISVSAIIAFVTAYQRRRRLLQQNNVEELRKELMKEKCNPDLVLSYLKYVKQCIEVGDSEKAVEQMDMIARHIEQVLRFSGRELIPLSMEIEYLRSFLSVQNQMHGKPIEHRIESNIMQNAGAILVPSMITQPFLENALADIMAFRYQDKIKFDIAFMRRGNVLEVIIEDNGAEGNCPYACKSLEEKYMNRGIAVSFSQINRGKGFKNRPTEFGYIRSEDRFDGKIKTGHRVCFSLPLMM